MADGLNLDSWWDEPDYKAYDTFSLRGDAANPREVMFDLCRNEQPS